MYIDFFFYFLHILWFILVIWAILGGLHSIHFFDRRLHFIDIGHLVTWALFNFWGVLATVQQKTFLSMFTYCTVSCGLLYVIMKIKYNVKKREAPCHRGKSSSNFHRIITFKAFRTIIINRFVLR